MTHLGVCSASAAASKGFETIGFDPEADLVRRLTAGDLPVLEPGLAELVQADGARLRFSSEFAQLSACDLIYVSPDIPTDDVGRSDLTRVDQLLDLVVEAARPDACIVVLSQVPPGFARSRSRPGRPLFYQVETLIFGRAVERAIRPER